MRDGVSTHHGKPHTAITSFMWCEFLCHPRNQTYRVKTYSSSSCLFSVYWRGFRPKLIAVILPRPLRVIIGGCNHLYSFRSRLFRHRIIYVKGNSSPPIVAHHHPSSANVALDIVSIGSEANEDVLISRVGNAKPCSNTLPQYSHSYPFTGAPQFGHVRAESGAVVVACGGSQKRSILSVISFHTQHYTYHFCHPLISPPYNYRLPGDLPPPGSQQLFMYPPAPLPINQLINSAEPTIFYFFFTLNI